MFAATVTNCLPAGERRAGSGSGSLWGSERVREGRTTRMSPYSFSSAEVESAEVAKKLDLCKDVLFDIFM